MKSEAVLLAAAAACALTLMAFASSLTEHGFESCENMVQSWAHSAYAFDDEIEANKSLQELLFFVHVPRTGGFTFLNCVLMQLYLGRMCPVSCDMQGWDSRMPKCGTFNLHGDYSLMSKLPRNRTSVVTMMRHPLDRVISNYELSTAAAARYLFYPNLSSATEAAERQCLERPHTVCLLDIWPFNNVVPWLAVELFAGRDARGNQSIISENIDPYNMDQIAVPLHDFVNNPIVHELVHNAATLQIAGLTEKSCLEESHTIRRCIRLHPSLGNYVLDVAKKRLDKMLFVGLNEKHRESMQMFAHSIEAELQVLSTTRTKAAGNYKTEKNSSLTNVEIEKLILQQNDFTPEYRLDFLLGNYKMSNGNAHKQIQEYHSTNTIT